MKYGNYVEGPLKLIFNIGSYLVWTGRSENFIYRSTHNLFEDGNPYLWDATEHYPLNWDCCYKLGYRIFDLLGYTNVNNYKYKSLATYNIQIERFYKELGDGSVCYHVNQDSRVKP